MEATDTQILDLRWNLPWCHSRGESEESIVCRTGITEVKDPPWFWNPLTPSIAAKPFWSTYLWMYKHSWDTNPRSSVWKIIFSENKRTLLNWSGLLKFTPIHNICHNIHFSWIHKNWIQTFYCQHNIYFFCLRVTQNLLWKIPRCEMIIYQH